MILELEINKDNHAFNTRLDKIIILLELIQKKGDRHISLDEAINSLIEDHYLENSKKGR
jgi:hypothetical protein